MDEKTSRPPRLAHDALLAAAGVRRRQGDGRTSRPDRVALRTPRGHAGFVLVF